MKHYFVSEYRCGISSVPTPWRGKDRLQLAKEVHTFSSVCEQILSTIATSRPLTQEEAATIEHYCVEILDRLDPFLRKAS
jgi:hypothetical protein